MQLISQLIGVSTLDAVSFGLITPVLNPQILYTGGSHKLTGFLVTLYVLAQIFGGTLSRHARQYNGQKAILFITIAIGLVTHLILGFAQSCYTIVIFRFVYYITNQNQAICKQLIVDNVQKDQASRILSYVNGLYTLGFTIGSIIGGNIFEYTSRGFLYINLLMSLGSLLMLALVKSLPSTLKDSEKTLDKGTSLSEKITDKLVTMKISTIPKEKQDRLLMKVKLLTTISFTVFFQKYITDLVICFDINFQTIGNFVAFQSIVLFVAVLLESFVLRSFIKNVSKRQKLLYTLGALTLSGLGVAFAPNLRVYLANFVCLIICRTIFDSIWPEYCPDAKRKDMIDRLNVYADLNVPLIFGAFCDIFKEKAVKMFIVAPLFISFVLVQIDYFEKKNPKSKSVKSKAKKTK